MRKRRSVGLLVVMLLFCSGFCCIGYAQHCLPPIEELYDFDYLSVNKGLSQNAVTSIIQNKDGYIIIGTYYGLNIFDGFTNTVKTHSVVDTEKNTLGNNRVLCLHEAADGRIWIGTESGISLYNLDGDCFEDVAFINQNLHEVFIRDINSDRYGNLFICGNGLTIVKQGKTGESAELLNVAGLERSTVTSLTFDHKGNAWITTTNGLYFCEEYAGEGQPSAVFVEETLGMELNTGMCDDKSTVWIGGKNELFTVGNTLFDSSKVTFRIVYKDKPLLKQSFRDVFCMAQDQTGGYWMGCKSGGMIHFKESRQGKAEKIRYYNATASPGYRLMENDVRGLLVDRNNTLWVGTQMGVNYTSLLPTPFYYFKPLLRNEITQDGFKSYYTQHIYSDSQNNLWISTFGNGLFCYKMCEDTLRELPQNFAEGMYFKIVESQNGSLWFLEATQLGYIPASRISAGNYTPTILNLEEWTGESSKKWMYFSMSEDRNGAIWVGGIGYILRYNPSTGTVLRYDGDNGIPNNQVYTLYQDSYEMAIWVGTKGGGLLRIRYDGNADIQIEKWEYDKSNGQSTLNSNHVWTLYRGQDRTMWIGTDSGLNRLVINEKETVVGVEIVNMPLIRDTKILSINEDVSGHLWIGASQGLFRYAPDSGAITRYTNEDGLLNNTLTEAACMTRNGWMFVGGINGVNFFNPTAVCNDDYPCHPILTEFRILNTPVSVGQQIGKRIMLDKNLNNSPLIRLNYKQNNFMFTFVSDNIVAPKKTQYRYRLEGYDTAWNEVDYMQRFASYSNLQAGEYTFRLQASSGNGVWTGEEKSLKVAVLPPPWATGWAYSVYAVLFVGIVFLLVKFLVVRKTWQYKIEKEKQERVIANELNETKINFFTNITHELRTPLILINEPLRDIIEEAAQMGSAMLNKLLMVQRNSERLLLLINQLLDMRAASNQNLPLCVSQQNMNETIDEVIESFRYSAEKSGITIVTDYKNEGEPSWFDADKLKKILFNLLSNSLKHTPVGGKVSVGLHTVDSSWGKTAVISVKDTGGGIPADEQDKVFRRFFRGVESKEYGSGIGLSFSQVLVEAHLGEISLESEEGKGVTVSVRLPVSRERFKPEHLLCSMQHPQERGGIGQETPPANDMRKTILVVEDNEDMREYIKEIFQKEFNVQTASDGVACLEILSEMKILPDLIMTDVMMPRMDGIVLVRQLKSDFRTRVIPVVMYSIKNDEQSISQAIEAGAEEYITKPFNSKLLIMKISGLLSSRDDLVRKVIIERLSEPSPVEVISNDETLILKMKSIIDKHMLDSAFGVSLLSSRLGMSRMQLNRRVRSITGMSPSEFIRDQRLKKAAQLLSLGEHRVSEVFYETGFSSSTRFNKFFKEKYGVSPREYRSNNKNN